MDKRLIVTLSYFSGGIVFFWVLYAFIGMGELYWLIVIISVTCIMVLFMAVFIYLIVRPRTPKFPRSKQGKEIPTKRSDIKILYDEEKEK